VNLDEIEAADVGLCGNVFMQECHSWRVVPWPSGVVVLRETGETYPAKDSEAGLSVVWNHAFIQAVLCLSKTQIARNGQAIVSCTGPDSVS
jgi:hypothetical protein